LSKKRLMPKRHSPRREWEQALIDAYYDHRWRQILQPLHNDFRCWAAGELAHADLDRAIHETHNKGQELYGLFAQSRYWLVWGIQFDEDWYQGWVKDHPMPAEPTE
jgi:hypothetical protein